MPHVRVNVVARDRAHAAEVLRHASPLRQTLREAPDGTWSVDAVADEHRLGQLADAGYTVTRLDRAAPKADYLTVAQVEARTKQLAHDHPGLVQLIALPEKTWEQRTCHAVRLGSGAAGVYLLGGVHAREWGSPDMLVALGERLAKAYEANAPLKLGRKTFAAAEVKHAVDGCSLYLFPQCNPDGRHHSLTADEMWRKNRRPPAEPHAKPECWGVDLNRNFDFLWDFERAFDPAAAVSDSSSPCDYELYHGPAAASEPEVRNVVWLLAQHPEIGYFVDIHSYGELIMYSWGDDQDQQKDPAMNFRNPAFDGKRGRQRDAYGEWFTPDDRTRAIALADGMKKAIAASRGRTYKVQQSMDLYPTAGTSDDYAYSRHFVDAHLTNTISFTIEWGRDTFHPPYAEMAKIIDEVCAGLVELCRMAAA